MTNLIRIREEEAAAVATSETLQVCEVAGVLAADPQGRKWRVRIFEYGLSKNQYAAPGGSKLPLKWTERAAQSMLPLLEGARSFADHGKGGVRDLIGFFSNAALGPKGPEADLSILESEQWVMDKMLAAHKLGRALGFSVDAAIQFAVAPEGQGKVLEVVAVQAINSVDLVSRASSGGAPLKVLEDEQVSGSNSPDNLAPANGALTNKGATMKEQIKKVLESLRAIPGIGAAFVAEAANIEAETQKETPDESALMIRATEAFAKASAEAVAAAKSTAGEVGKIETQVATLTAQVAEAQKKQQASDSALLVREKLDSARLPMPARQLVEKRYPAGTVATAEQIDLEIKSVREAFAAMVPNPTRISGVSAISESGLTGYEKLQTALDRMMGVTHEWNEVREGQMIKMVKGKELDRAIPAFQGIREAYTEFTGDPDVRGVISESHLRRIREEWNNAGFPAAFNNTMGRLMLQDYNTVDYGVLNLISRSSVPDFKTQERVRLGYLGDIPNVTPETVDYAELAAPTDEKATFTMGQKGAIVTITRQAIINDDLGAIGKIVGRLGRAAARTLAQHVTDFFIANAAIYDGDTWFHANHSNTGTTALAVAELAVIRTAFRAFTEKNSLKKLGLTPYHLMVPNELEGAALKANQSEYLTNSLSDRSTTQYMFGQSNERIILNHLLADATDYYVIGRIEDAPILEVGFLQGRQEPELFLADGETTSERMFLSDKIRYKIRHEYKGVVVDFRNVYKEVVAG